MKVLQKSESGFGLIEVMITVSIISISLFASINALTGLQVQLKSIDQRMESLDLKRYMTEAMQVTSVCACQLNPDLTADSSNDSNLAFNSNITTGLTLNVKKVKTGCAADSPPIAYENQVLPSGLRINSIKLQNLRPSGASSKEWVGEWQIGFLTGSGFPVKPLTMKQSFIIDNATPSNASIDYCGRFIGGSGGTSAWSPTNPGPGCEGLNCVAQDFGPCFGSNCTTNGKYCSGMNCIAYASMSSCKGDNCCAGTSCCSKTPLCKTN